MSDLIAEVTVLQSEMLDARDYLREAEEQFELLLNRIAETDFEDISGAVLTSQREQASARIAALEETLDLQPREVIQLVLLEEQIESFRIELAETQSQLLREVDRAYNTVLALIGALLIAFLAMLAANLLKQISSASTRPAYPPKKAGIRLSH